MTPLRGSRAASAISSSTRWGSWSTWWCTGGHPGSGAADLPKSIPSRWPWLRHVFADGGYAGYKLKGRLKKIGQWTIEIIKRTFAWLGRCRRLDWEKSIATAAAWIIIAHSRILIQFRYS